MKNTKRSLLVGSRKGLIVYRLRAGGWAYQKVDFTGIPVSIAWADERNGTWWACLDHGHWGSKLHYSNNEGNSWHEVSAPAYPEGEEIKEGVPASVRLLWAMAGGGVDQPGTLYLGTEPGGLFKSTNDGKSFDLVHSLWNHPSRGQWFGGGRDYAGIHSILVDPRNTRHLFVGISCAGVFESWDGGENWMVRNKGMKADFLPDPYSEIGQDPHMVVAAPGNPDVMWQQNHCGIFRTSDGGKCWEDVSQKGGPAHFGFAIAADEKDPDVAWVVPAISDGIRVPADQALCVCRTDDGGRSWKTFRNGLPQKACFDIVYRHALAVSENTLLFGTTTGNLFVSDDRGENWNTLSNHLPMVYSLFLTN